MGPKHSATRSSESRLRVLRPWSRSLVKQNVQVPDIKVDYDWKVLQLTFLPTQVKDLESLA